MNQLTVCNFHSHWRFADFIPTQTRNPWKLALREKWSPSGMHLVWLTKKNSTTFFLVSTGNCMKPGMNHKNFGFQTSWCPQGVHQHVWPLPVATYLQVQPAVAGTHELARQGQTVDGGVAVADREVEQLGASPGLSSIVQQHQCEPVCSSPPPPPPVHAPQNMGKNLGVVVI